MALEDANPIKGVSGPGKYAKRLDRIPANFYGDQSQIADIASGAPLAKTPDVKAQAMPEMAAQAKLTPLFAPTERPSEPVTTGIDIGPGAGSEVLGLQSNVVQGQYQNAYELFNRLASNPNASPTLKYLAQRIQQGF